MSAQRTGGWGITRKARVNDCHPERKHYAGGLCRECYRSTDRHKAQRHAYYKKNIENYRKHQQSRTERCVPQKRLYGVSAEQIKAMLEAQGYVCAICGAPPKRKALAVDHDHNTGRVRAMLCHPCNGALGLMRDDPERLRKAIAYLEHHDSVSAQATTTRTAREDAAEEIRCGGMPSSVWKERAGDQPANQGCADMHSA